MTYPLVYIVAGNYEQARHYADLIECTGSGQGGGYGRAPWVYVSGPNTLRDRTFDPKQVHYTGTWEGRPDKDAILDAVRLSAYQEQP